MNNNFEEYYEVFIRRHNHGHGMPVYCVSLGDVERISATLPLPYTVLKIEKVTRECITGNVVEQ